MVSWRKRRPQRQSRRKRNRRNNATNDEPFILHNVDVISNIDLQRMVEVHKQSAALATLAVQERKTSRYLLFNDHLQLCGRRLVKEDKTEIVRPSAKYLRTGVRRHSRNFTANISPPDGRRRLLHHSRRICGWQRTEKRFKPSAPTNITGATWASRKISSRPSRTIKAGLIR